LNTKVRISALVTCSATEGTARVQMFDLAESDTVPIDDSTLRTALNTTTGIDRIRVGRKAASSVDATDSTYLLSWAYDPDATDFIPTPEAPAPVLFTFGRHIIIGG
jgi:hypothetical protein